MPPSRQPAAWQLEERSRPAARSVRIRRERAGVKAENPERAQLPLFRLGIVQDDEGRDFGLLARIHRGRPEGQRLIQVPYPGIGKRVRLGIIKPGKLNFIEPRLRRDGSFCFGAVSDWSAWRRYFSSRSAAGSF